MVGNEFRWTCPFCHKSQSSNAYHQCITSNVDCRAEWWRQLSTERRDDPPVRSPGAEGQR